MVFISLPIHSDSNVQPGWIYIKEENNFYPPIDKLDFKTENSYEIDVMELPEGKLNHLSEIIGNNYWQDDIKSLPRDQSFKMIYCLLTKKEIMKWQPKENIDYEYANEILYGNGIIMLLKFFKKSTISLKDVQYILDCKFKGSKVRDYIRLENDRKVISVNIYYNKIWKKGSSKYLSIPQAITEVVDVMRNMRKNDNLEAIKANVITLPVNAVNKSECKCIIKKDTIKSSHRPTRSIWKILEGVKNIFLPRYDQVTDENESYVKNMINFIDAETTKLNEPYPMTTYRNDYCNPHTNSINANVQNGGKSLVQANSMSNKPKEFDFKNKSEYPDLETSYKTNAISTFKSNRSSLESNAIFDDDGTKSVASTKDTWDKTISENSYKTKVERCTLREKKMETRNGLYATKDCMANLTIAAVVKDQSSKKNKRGLDQSKDIKEIHSSAKKVKLQPARRSDVKSGLSHHYYYESCKDTEEISKKNLILFGTDDPGKLSLLNLLFLCSQTDENVEKEPIVDVALKVENIAIYHFQTKSVVVEEWIIIVTPELKSDVLGSLKPLLSDGILNANALGFVVNSRSETLTSEERNFFSYIRSSFGEVSNNHLITFLTFCEFSRNFPVLNEMKHQGVKSKCVFELSSSDLGLNEALEGDDFTMGSAITLRELKKAKKVFKTLKELPLLSVKSMKIAHEKSFAETHREGCSKQFVQELEHFVTLVDEGKDRPIKESVQPIWRLARLLLTLEAQESSERDLLNFMAKALSVIPSKEMESKSASRRFLLLLFNCPERNFTATLKATLDYYVAIISSLYFDAEVPLSCSVLSENNTVPQYCNNCKDIHQCTRDTSDTDLLHVKCLSCRCPANSHSLWTFKDSNLLLNSFCEMARSALKDLCEELPSIYLTIPFNLFMDCLSKTFNVYEPFWKIIAEKRK